MGGSCIPRARAAGRQERKRREKPSRLRQRSGRQQSPCGPQGARVSPPPAAPPVRIAAGSLLATWWHLAPCGDHARGVPTAAPGVNLRLKWPTLSAHCDMYHQSRMSPLASPTWRSLGSHSPQAESAQGPSFPQVSQKQEERTWELRPPGVTLETCGHASGCGDDALPG